MEESDLPPVVPLPERLDRSLRLGPFASGRDALKFLAYVAVGALLVPWIGVAGWLAFLVAGLLVSLWQPEGEGLDVRVARLVRWRLRSIGRGTRMTPGRWPSGSPRSVVPLPDGGYAAVVRSGGIPLAYLPSSDLRQRFETYRELLRTVEPSLVLLSTRAPIHRSSFFPSEPSPVGSERTAREGYRELVDVIARRRFVRQVYLAITEPGTGPEVLGKLEHRVTALTERLAALGLRPLRLRDRSLSEAAERLGLAGPGGGP